MEDDKSYFDPESELVSFDEGCDRRDRTMHLDCTGQLPREPVTSESNSFNRVCGFQTGKK